MSGLSGKAGKTGITGTSGKTSQNLILYENLRRGHELPTTQ